MAISSSQPLNPLKLRRVALLFSGGPAPAANAVISTAAVSFLRHKIEVVGILNGYSNLETYQAERGFEAQRDYVLVDHKMLRRTRNTRGILLGTARANPGSEIATYDDLKDANKTRKLRAVYDALRSIQVDALISIGGDDTLKTANKFSRFQREQLGNKDRIAVIHIPKTIDNDYAGIDFTFGYFTAVETMAVEIQNLLADAEATRSYYVAETMGRYAGWLAYGAAIAGEASMVLSVEDVVESPEGLLEDETVTDQKLGTFTRKRMKLQVVVDRVINTILNREREGKAFGVFVLAEGLAAYLPWEYIKDATRDPHGHLNIASISFARIFSSLLTAALKQRELKSRKITGVTLGYEARCATPHAFDVLLGSALGVGAYRALVEHGRDEVMVSTLGQLNLRFVPFDELINPETMMSNTRYIPYGSDFHRLARFLETYVVD